MLHQYVCQQRHRCYGVGFACWSCRRSYLSVAIAVAFIVVILEHVFVFTLSPREGTCLFTLGCCAVPRRVAIASGISACLAQPPFEAHARSAPRALPSLAPLSQRLSSTPELVNPRLSQQQSAETASSVYPAWLFGEWEVRSKLVGYGEPLGSRFVDEETRAAIQKDIANGGDELMWKSRFYWASLDDNGVVVTPKRPGPSDIAASKYGYLAATEIDAPAMEPSRIGPVVQFRAFNAAQEVRAFLGQRIPNVISEADPRAKPLKVFIAYPELEGEEDVVRTVRLSLDASSRQEAGDTFISSELFRQVTATNDEVDSVGDFEVINAYQLVDETAGRVSVRNRVAKYLVPEDPLYAQAAGNAVSFLDYSWDMRRVRTCIDTPYGEQCARAL